MSEPRQHHSDAVVRRLLCLPALLAGAIVLAIALFLVNESVPALFNVGPARFFTDPSWHPARDAQTGSFNLGPLLIGTMATTVGALLLTAPFGLASALFCRFHAPRRLGMLHRRTLELLAGIPSVVFGLWGLTVLAPAIGRWQPPGQSLLAGILILALMILPTFALLAEAALRSVPRAQLDGAAALGLSRWATIRCVALPGAKSGIATALLLATSRALGETMAVLMVAGNVVQVPDSLFDPIRTLTANIALELGYATDVHRSALFVAGLLLLALVVSVVASAEWLGREKSRAPR